MFERFHRVEGQRGRTHEGTGIGLALVQELVRLRDFAKPQEILLVLDAATGQEAVNVATHFDQALNITGSILTKLDGDARGGAALSMKAVTGKPINELAMIPLTFATALSTPFPPYRLLSPSRSSTASCSPVEAPLGTEARAKVPSSR